MPKILKKRLKNRILSYKKHKNTCDGPIHDFINDRISPEIRELKKDIP